MYIRPSCSICNNYGYMIRAKKGLHWYSGELLTVDQAYMIEIPDSEKIEISCPLCELHALLF